MTDVARVGHWSNVDLARRTEPQVVSAGAAAAEPRDTTAEPAAPLEFVEVYDQHFDFAWRSLRRLGVAERHLDDAVQDAFLVVHRRLSEFEGRSSLRSWLFGIVRRVAHDYRRRARRKERGEPLVAEHVADPRRPSPLEAASRGEAVRALYAVLDSLDDGKRETFILAELEQMTAPEIAAALDVNLNTVYSRLRAARRAVNRAVARHDARASWEER